MMRALVVAGCLVASIAAAAPSKRGPWGEDPAVVPDYAPTEERRAPKLYDNTRVFARLPERDAPRLDDALLVCHAIVRGSWDFLGAPDVTLRFVLGKEPAIKLWGPEDHSDFYVSIPRIHLAAGDRVDVTAWDRDVTKVEYIGVAHGRYDGHLPLHVTSHWFDLDCNAVETDEALTLARPHLDRIDERLAAFEAARPDAAVWDYGRSLGDGAIKGRFYVGTMRYAAGAVGWDHPEVRARVARLAAAEVAWQKARATAAAALLASRRAPGVTTDAFGAHFTTERWVCGQKARPLFEAIPASECAVVVRVAVPPDRPLPCSRAGLTGIAAAAIDRHGDFHAASPLCVGSEQSSGELVFAVGRDDLVGIWLSDGKTVVLLGIE
ncbi:MAG TPA: hypothetical protein VGL86_29795 [Polyangia bacterium]|jgi:hypothetical protein